MSKEQMRKLMNKEQILHTENLEWLGERTDDKEESVVGLQQGYPCECGCTCINMFMYESESHSVVSNFLQPHGLYSPWNSSGQNAGVGSCSLLQGIFPTQELNWGLLHCRWIFYQLSCQGRTYICMYIWILRNLLHVEETVSIKCCLFR